MLSFGSSSSSSRSDQLSARRVPVEWPRDAEEKSDENEKLSERSEFFSFRFILSIAGSGQSSGSPPLWLLSSGEAEESDSPTGQTGGRRTTALPPTRPFDGPRVTGGLARIHLIARSPSPLPSPARGEGTERSVGNLLPTCRLNYFKPAAARNTAALSVASQVNSGSSRPKCPYAAVFS